MKSRYLTDEFLAGALWGFGMAMIISIWFNRSADGKLHSSQCVILPFGFLCCTIGGWLYRIAQRRKRLNLDASEKPDSPQAQ